ncbi:MAG: VOC family protein [Betaproteobacteria bacterium]|nr:VOC family protein [Betaproteobacteria bacterium]
MQAARLDHLVICASTLASGIAYVREALGISPDRGGEHVRMGTHNCLLRLGECLYLEVIAINPAAPTPKRPRWFALDAGYDTPRLAAWVARVPDIRAASAAAARTGLDAGQIEGMDRGALRWQITLTADGNLPFGGVAPILIQWETAHPVHAMRDAGCSLTRVEARHPDAGRICAVLDAIRFDGPVSVVTGQAPAIEAVIDTPAGERRLRA